jgi:hypothetical protein
VESSCEFGIEPSASIKCWETIEYPNNMQKHVPLKRWYPCTTEQGIITTKFTILILTALRNLNVIFVAKLIV